MVTVTVPCPILRRGLVRVPFCLYLDALPRGTSFIFSVSPVFSLCMGVVLYTAGTGSWSYISCSWNKTGQWV